MIRLRRRSLFAAAFLFESRAVLAIAAISLAAAIPPATASDADASGAKPAGAPDGKALYDAKCGLCHGADGVPKPMTKNSGNFSDPAWQASHTDDDLLKTIREGRPATMMTAFKDRLDDAQMRAIVAHIRTLAKKP